MHHPRKPRPTHLHLNILTWKCDEHGPHRVIVAGLDETSDLVADMTAKHFAEDGSPPHLTTELIPLDDALRGAYWSGHDDLPY